MSSTLLKYDILYKDNPLLLLSKKRLFFMENEAYYARERRKIEKELVEYHVYGKEGPKKTGKKVLT
tara:strand:+ start:194 stop:391 length:198 start_codon:yes stop_codon:yes gene_type:complete